MSNYDLLGFAYAASVAFGGVLGYVRAGSVPSLASGLIFGVLAGYGAYRSGLKPADYTIMLGKFFCATIFAMGVENVAIVDCISELLENGVYIAGALTGQRVTAESNTFPWRLCTKYYDVDLNVWVTSVSDLIEPTGQVDETRAIIFYWDGLDSSCFQACWNALLNRESIGVRLLLCENVVSEEVRESTLAWCIENAFEMIFLQPSDDIIMEAAENCEKIGLDRIIEALQAHEWTALIRKDSDNYVQLITDDDDDEEGAENKSDSSVEERTSSSSSSGGSFTDLYEHFSSMVAHSKTLTGDQRKKYAAQVATQFWNSLKISEHSSSSSSDLSDGSDVK
ncbi:transmembrane protein 14C [Trichuris suis]|nr:transmembrane protein 14C [Trichuris suis]